MAEVRFDRVRKVYANGHVGVSDASFEVADGELFVLVGPSGCGKSTLLRMVAGLEAVSSGTIAIGGRIVNDVAARDRDIAMVFQNYALYPHMTVEENLGFGLRMRGHPAAEIATRVQETARTLGIGQVLAQRPGTLSGGQRQRVALGRAIVRKPSVFLLDEPLSNLDAKLRAATRVEIARLQRTLGATMIYVTHDQVEAMTLGRRIAVLKEGVVQQVGEPLAIYAQPVNLFVAGFFGSPAMNFLRGIVDAGTIAPVGADTKIAIGNMPRVHQYEGRELVVGLRPEDLQLAGADAQAGAAMSIFSAQLEFAESLGNETFLNLRCGAVELTSRIRPTMLPPNGTEVRLTFAPDKLHFFDPRSGERV
jgi:multiple sugar transport system ATP-binding protein